MKPVFVFFYSFSSTVVEVKLNLRWLALTPDIYLKNALRYVSMQADLIAKITVLVSFQLKHLT